jgi:DNA topoisomerase-3
MVNPPTVLNVAEKPSVARALAAVFARMPGARDAGMRREAHQIFTHENVCFPNVYAQGEGRIIEGPGKSVASNKKYLKFRKIGPF